MKRLFYLVFVVFAFAIIFNYRCQLFGWGCPPVPPVNVVRKTFVVTMPESADSIGFKSWLESKGLINKHIACPCSNGTQLWDGDINFHPDHDPPNMFLGANVASNDTILFEKSPEIANITRKNPTKGTPIRIAIVDTGIDTLNKELKSFLYRNPVKTYFCNTNTFEGRYGMNMLYVSRQEQQVEPIDRSGHGTFINGIVAGYAQFPPYSNQQDADLGTPIKLLNVKIGDRLKIEGIVINTGTLFDAICGLHYAIEKKSMLINASWGVKPKPDNVNSAGRAFLTALDKVQKDNITLIASAGNDGEKNIMIFPAAFATPITLTGGRITQFDYSKNVISVGSWNTNTVINSIADHSNQGENVNLYAPGADIISFGLSSSTFPASGTSFATPFVTRRLARILDNRMRNRTNTNNNVLSGLKIELMRQPNTTQIGDYKVLTMPDNS